MTGPASGRANGRQGSPGAGCRRVPGDRFRTADADIVPAVADGFGLAFASERANIRNSDCGNGPHDARVGECHWTVDEVKADIDGV